ncbi:ABC transporter ATP-binding protein [Candidatus Thiodiazotropha sp. CDECU1]|uniref:ABC transporter ATP-binding protein n=1 Tax=Candidatus Thiodiazotropha sp. CDECU1 TaxID=3065865 RepID=UPI00292CACC8|nr:ATP-binding cassette domain-containing protein [Candidatus Thiodiazotropha sp. CDECU1]
MPELLTTTQLSRQFGGTPVVSPIDLQLKPGDILGLLGPNGAGKSTIMRMLSGDLAPSAGTISICGEDLLIRPIHAKRFIGYLPERPPLHRDQTVDEYLWDCAHLHGLKRSRSREAREQTKQRCGLEQAGRRLIRKLSKGYQQRVGLAQAIIHNPRVVILDEPSDGLDPVQIRQVRELIQELAPRKGVILSSHILPEIEATCNRVTILQQGKSVYSGEITPPTQTSYRIGLEQSPELDALTGLAAVAGAEQLHSDYYRISLKSGCQPSELAQQILAQGWGLIELKPERISLEQLFLEATTGGVS